MLLGIPCAFIGLYGVIGVITAKEMIAGFVGALWGYGAVAGAYELNRRKFDWDRGRRFSDHHLLGGTIAVAFGLAVSGAIHETMPALALVPALSAAKQASDGHPTKLLSWIHAGLIVAGSAAGIWLYRNEGIGKLLLARLVELP